MIAGHKKILDSRRSPSGGSPVPQGIIRAEDVNRPASTYLAAIDCVAKTHGGFHKIPNRIPIKRYWQCAIEAGFATCAEGRIALLPLTTLPINLMQRGLDSQPLRENFRDHGIFGNRDSRSSTYFASPDWKGETYGWDTPNMDRSHRLVIRINAEKLLASRRVYIDPESVNDRLEGCIYFREMGKSFMVLGGIPKVAIVAIECPRGEARGLPAFDWSHLIS